MDHRVSSVFHPWPIPPPSRENCSRDLELLAEIGYEYMGNSPLCRRWHQHIQSLVGLTQKNARQARPEDLQRVLVDRGIAYRIQERGCYDQDILNETIRLNHGAVIGFRELSPGAGGHIVTLVDFGKTEVRVIDPNDADHRVRTLSRERFLHWWDGFVIVLTAEYTAPITSVQSSAPALLQK